MTEPTTPTGRAQHDMAWSDIDASTREVICGHSPDRDHCIDCDLIARIEVEARQQIYDLLASEEDPEHAMWTLHGIRDAIDHLNEADR